MGLDSRTYIHGQGFHSMSSVSKERWEEIFGKKDGEPKRAPRCVCGWCKPLIDPFCPVHGKK